MSVKVAIRVRPFNQRQKFLGCVCCVQMKEKTTVVYENRGKQKKQHFFTFDYSFWSHDGFEQRQDGELVSVDEKYIDQTGIYKLLGEQILENAWVGFNCCLFAYGQTGAGKSYSMIGYGANKGIIPLACEQLFARIGRFERKGQREYEVTISMLEIYNEKVQDLLINTNKRSVNGLKIRQNKTLGVYVEGLNKFPVTSYKQIQKKMDEGSKNRSLASTLMNQYSSRAHTIVMLEFIQKEWVTKTKMSKKTSLINLVDLAGSQRVGKTGVDNKDRLKEASLINKSLHTLGRCIEALAELSNEKKGKAIAVPYRDSVLTRILENALGGNSKTTMICAISPANDNYQQTLSTLRYADKTKKIKNKPVVNESQVDKLIRQLREQNQRLKQMLDSPNEGLSHSPSNSRDQAKNKADMNSNVRASMRQIQKEIKKNMESFSLNSVDAIEEDLLGQDSMLADFAEYDEANQQSELDVSFTSQINGKTQAYITNLNQDQMLNFKVRYSCENNLLITNQSNKGHKLNQIDESTDKFPKIKKVILCGLGIEENHARIIRQGEKYYIEAMSELASEYTLLNGKPVYDREEVYHNDRIILGINTVFLFKNADSQQRKDTKYPNQRAIGYQFALNERQNQYEDENSIFGLSNSPSRIRSNSKIKSRSPSISRADDKELKSRLDQIQSEFTRMMQENQRKVKEKEERYKEQLSKLQRQKQLKDLERQDLQSRLKQKKEQTYKLRSRELQIEKLQKKLAKYQKEKKKRLLYRQSLLLQDTDNNTGLAEPNSLSSEFQCQTPTFDMISDQQSQIGIDAIVEQRQKSKPHIKNKAQPQPYDQLLIDQYDDQTDKDKTLLTTQANITNITSTTMQAQQSYLEASGFENRVSADGKMKKGNVNNQKVQIDELAQVEKYKKFAQDYFERVKKSLRMFTKLYDITIQSEAKPSQTHLKIHKAKKEDAQEKEKVSQPVSSLRPSCDNGQHYCEKCHNAYEINESQQRKDTERSSESQKDMVIRLNRSNISEMLASKNSEYEKSRGGKSSSADEQSMLLSGINMTGPSFDSQFGITRNRSGSENNVKGTAPQKEGLQQIPEASIQESRHLPKSALQLTRQEEMILKNRQILDNQQITQGLEKSMLELYIPSQNYAQELQQQHRSELLYDQRDKFDLSPSNFELNNRNPSQRKVTFSEVQIQTDPQDQFERKQQPRSISFSQHQSQPQSQSLSRLQTQQQAQQIYQENRLQVPTKKPANKKSEAKSSKVSVDFDLSMSDIELTEHDLTVDKSLNFSSLNTFKQQELNQQIQELKAKIKLLQQHDSSKQIQSATNKNLANKGELKSQQIIKKLQQQQQQQQISKSKSKTRTKKKASKQDKQKQKGKSEDQQNSQQQMQQRRKQKKSSTMPASLVKKKKSKNLLDQQNDKQRYQSQGSNDDENNNDKEWSSSNSPIRKFNKKLKSPNKNKQRLTELPSNFSEKAFLKRAKSMDDDLEKELQSNLIQCNNENIMNERNLNLRKKKREMEQLKKSLFQKEKMELQKQLFLLIPMVERFNRIAKEMGRLIQGKVEIEYKNFSYYDIIEALKNFTKSKFGAKRDTNFSNVQIRIVIANLQQARIYKWPLQVFKNRFEIAQQIFQKYIETSDDELVEVLLILNIYQARHKQIDKNKDPFWDPLDYVQSGVGYLSMQCLLYDVGYEGYISFVHNCRLIAKAYVILSPVKVGASQRRRSTINNQIAEQINNLSTTIPERPDSSLQILNPRAFIQTSLYFTVTIESIQFMQPVRDKTSDPLKFKVEYQLLVDDYRNETYSTPETDFRSYDEEHQVNYMRRHCFKNVSQSTLTYVTDCPIVLSLQVMKDYNEECLNSSFNQDLVEQNATEGSFISQSNQKDPHGDKEKEVEGTNAEAQRNNSIITRSLTQNKGQLAAVNKQASSSTSIGMKTPIKSNNGNSSGSGNQNSSASEERPDFSKKIQKPLFYQNTEIMEKMNRQYDRGQEEKRRQKKRRLQEQEMELKLKKEKLRKEEKQCNIY